MAITGTYNTSQVVVPEIYTASSGGTVFSANLATNTVFDYFSNSAVVNDAIYFATNANGNVISDLTFNVGTAIAGTGITIVWEYYKTEVGWTAMEYVKDDTVGFTITGSNRVRFPLQWKRNQATINGLSRMWTRCRISALTTITEGGANQTTRVQYSDGKVTIAGGTDSVPATFTDLYNWCVANITYVTFTKRNINSFDFTRIAFLFTGRCITTNETIEVGSAGPGSQGMGTSSLNYVTSGIKAGTRGYSGSTFIIYGAPNTGVMTSAVDTKLYGTVIRTGRDFTDHTTFEGYHSLLGENIDCFFELSSYLGQASVVNSRICDGIVIASGAPTTYTGNTYICNSNLLLYSYTTSYTLTDFSYQFIPVANNHLVYLYSGSSIYSPQWNFVNPGTPIGLMSDPVTRAITLGINISNLAGCKFYDASAGTYTNYLTQATDVTANDVPLSGDVGDYYLFGANNFGGSGEATCLDFILPTQTNDYVYIWEAYIGSSWTAIDTNWIWDGTLNLTRNGGFFSSATSLATVAIDGVSTRWIRARIVTKGTTSPVASRIRQRICSGVSKWSMKEQWSVDLKIVDSSGSPISGATVIASNGYSSFSVTTNATGIIVQQVLTSKEWHFDPISSQTTYISENLYPTFNLTISKAGYETYTSSGVTLDKKVNSVITLKPSIPTRIDVEGGIYSALTPETGSSSGLLKIS